MDQSKLRDTVTPALTSTWKTWKSKHEVLKRESKLNRDSRYNTNIKLRKESKKKKNAFRNSNQN